MSQLKEYLNYYLSLENPGYSVLVTGAWGVGKTFQVKECIKEEDRYYVSLFGVQSIEDIHGEIFAIAFPKLAKAGKFVDSMSETAKDVGGVAAIGGLGSKIFSAAFRRDLEPTRTLIFDDLERSKIDIKELIGAINFYIEQKGFRVIVIAHDEKILGEFDEIKEKIFGQTISVDSKIDEAFLVFLEKVIKEESRIFIKNYREDIIRIFELSRHRSLRILRHLIEDLSRIYECLGDKHKNVDEAMRNLVGLFSVFCIETRAGFLKRGDIIDRQKKKYGYSLFNSSKGSGQPSEKPAIVLVDAKYPDIDVINDNMISDDILVSMHVDGRYDQVSIQNSLDNSAFFIEPGEVPPWRVVINFDELEDAAVGAGMMLMEKQFQNRESNVPGEMLHIFSLRLMMVESNIMEGCLKVEKDKCINYIDDLFINEDLPILKSKTYMNEIEESFGGYGYWITNKTKIYFEEIFLHLSCKIQESFERQLPAISQNLIQLMSSDIDGFFQKISVNSVKEDEYGDVSVFHVLDPNAFVEAWISVPHIYWRKIKSVLQYRYEYFRNREEFKKEINWALEVRRIILRKADSVGGISDLRMRRAIPKILNEMAQDA